MKKIVILLVFLCVAIPAACGLDLSGSMSGDLGPAGPPPVMYGALTPGLTTEIVTVTSGSYAYMSSQTDNVLTSCRFTFSRDGIVGNTYMPQIQYASQMFMRDLLWVYDGAAGKVSAAEMRTALDVYLHWRITTNDQFVRPWATYIAGDNVYGNFLNGTFPAYMHSTETVSYLVAYPAYNLGDYTSLDYQVMFPLLGWHYGKKLGWDATWRTWWLANKSAIVEAYNVHPYNAVTGLMCNLTDNVLWSAPSWGFMDTMELLGDSLGNSITAYNASLAMAEMYYRGGGRKSEIAYWTARADALRAGLRASFKESVPRDEWYHASWQWFVPGVGVPDGWGANGAGGTLTIKENPYDNASSVVEHLDNNAASGVGMSFSLPARHRGGAASPTRFSTTMYAAQTNAGAGFRFTDAAGPYESLRLAMANDGHWKVYSGGAWANLPTDTTYSANTLYSVQLNLNWTTKTYDVLIDGINKGTVNFSDNNSTNIVSIYTTTASIANADQGTFGFGDFITWDPPTNVIDNVGYLYASSGRGGNYPSPEITAYAVWSRVLSTDQMTKASRFIKMLYEQPDFGIPANGTRNVFNFSDNNHGAARYRRHSDDYKPGVKAWRFVWDYPQSYNEYTHGGYWWVGYSWLVNTLNYAYPSDAATLLQTTLDNVQAGGVNYPHERVDSTTPMREKYSNSATAIFSPAASP